MSVNNNPAFSQEDGKSDYDYYNGCVPKIVVSDFEDKSKDKAKAPQISKQEKMKAVRESKLDKFKLMRERARGVVATGPCATINSLKSFGELSDSVMKLRENFDAILGKYPIDSSSPLKKKDLLSEFSHGVTGESLKNQDCETDEEETTEQIKQRA